MNRFNGIEEVYCALYVDFDNIFTRLYELDPELAHEFGSNPKRWIRWIEGHAVKILYGEGVRRRILKRVCYLNPRRYQEYRSYFTMAAFQVVDCPPMTRQEKTSTDIHLVMDCLDALHHQTHFGEFIILSGDSDFTPLLLRLQEYARKTLVLSVGYTSPAYASAATWRIREDWFISQSLEKEELSEGEYDDYDMDNHHEMLAMRQYASDCDNSLNHDIHDNLTQSHAHDRSHDRPKRYERNEREGYERRKPHNRDYQRSAYGSAYDTVSHTDNGLAYPRNDGHASYAHKKYVAPQHYEQDFMDEESHVNIPVKVISYADVKKTPETQDTDEVAHEITHDVHEESSLLVSDDVISDYDATPESHDFDEVHSDRTPDLDTHDGNHDETPHEDAHAEDDDHDNHDDHEVNGNTVAYQSTAISHSNNHGYASYASTLRQHGYADDIDDDIDEDDLDDADKLHEEVNGNIAQTAPKVSISEQAAEILKTIVMDSAQPVPAANIGQILQRELDAGLDWFGFGKLRDFLDHLDLAPLEFSPVPPGYLYDPNRHERPEERGNNDEFREKYPELFPFVLNVHRLTDMPLLLPEHYKQILGYIVEEVNTNGFFMTTTSRNVRDRCIEEGLPIARSHVNFVIVGVGRGGCPLNDKQGISMRDVAKAFLRNAYDLCRVAQMELGELESHQLMEWIMPKE